MFCQCSLKGKVQPLKLKIERKSFKHSLKQSYSWRNILYRKLGLKAPYDEAEAVTLISVVNWHCGKGDRFSMGFSLLGRSKALRLTRVWMWALPSVGGSLTATELESNGRPGLVKSSLWGGIAGTPSSGAGNPLGVWPGLQSQGRSSQETPTPSTAPRQPPQWPPPSPQTHISVSCTVYVSCSRKLPSVSLPFLLSLKSNLSPRSVDHWSKQISDFPKLALISFLWTNNLHQILAVFFSSIDFWVSHESS